MINPEGIQGLESAAASGETRAKEISGVRKSERGNSGEVRTVARVYSTRNILIDRERSRRARFVEGNPWVNPDARRDS